MKPFIGNRHLFLALGLLCFSGFLWGAGDTARKMFEMAGREKLLSGHWFSSTNYLHERAMVDALNEKGDLTLEVYQLSFTFFYPDQVGVLPSHADIAKTIHLKVSQTEIVREWKEGDLPVSSIRVYGSNRTNLVCEVDVLGGVVKGNQARRDCRWLLRYEYGGSWIEVPSKHKVIWID